MACTAPREQIFGQVKIPRLTQNCLRNMRLEMGFLVLKRVIPVRYVFKVYR